MTSGVNEATCIGCGCTDSWACPEGCSWVVVDRDKREGICSSCYEPGETIETMRRRYPATPKSED